MALSRDGLKPRCLHFMTIFSAVGILSGASIFCVFLLVYKNYNAAIWGLASGVYAAVVLHLHILFLRNVLFKMYGMRSFNCMKITGALSCLACVIACIVYITLAIVTKQGYDLYGNGYAPSAVFTLITLKWTFALLHSSLVYKKIMLQDAEVKNLFTGGVGGELSGEQTHGLSVSSSNDLGKTRKTSNDSN